MSPLTCSDSNGEPNTKPVFTFTQKKNFPLKKLGEIVLRVQLGFQSVISAFQTDEQKTDTLNRQKSDVQDINNND